MPLEQRHTLRTVSRYRVDTALAAHAIIESMGTAQILGTLFDASRSQRVFIRRGWHGYSRHAPINSRYDLRRDPSGGLTGVGHLSTGLTAERLLNVVIAPTAARVFLDALAATKLTIGKYLPRITHTDDLPSLEIGLYLDAGDPDAGAVLSTGSQGKFHSPWAVRVFNDEFVARRSEIGRALKALEHDLGEDTLNEMHSEGERLLDEGRWRNTLHAPYSAAAARKAHCWFGVDRVTRDPDTTAWKRHARFRQACWRTANEYPIGAEPYMGGADATPVGSRIELEFAQRTGANFMTPAALAAARARVQLPETHQMLNEARLWADLLSSMPLCFNLFGDLAADAEVASKSIGAWWPDAPQGSVHVRFEHSPGRCDTSFLGNKSAFDVAFEIAARDTRAVIGVEVKYHEHAAVEQLPKPNVLARYAEVSELSGVFRANWRTQLVGTDLQQIWLDHLLVLSMLQHPSQRWSFGRFVLVYPQHNPSFRSAAQRYHDVLQDAATFEARTIEELLERHAGPETTRVSLQGRYLDFTPG